MHLKMLSLAASVAKGFAAATAAYLTAHGLKAVCHFVGHVLAIAMH